eukprot:CAMPEP_0176009584 /NCGR_PEP_ID=MMETSP0120_2-20121206/4325_1 /TAXON_ID=160619 /ORGANISM="Kryptoperidinium foliaceum, Strain CCMP 1326" /LENGTH=1201 /DNA_ID=CAMNT_0017342383 /DNA_START=229 /DNA_END=3834 /DNA_ORIENTATION=-
MTKKISPNEEPNESRRGSSDPGADSSAVGAGSLPHRHANDRPVESHVRNMMRKDFQGEHLASTRPDEKNGLPWNAMAPHPSNDLRCAPFHLRGKPMTTPSSSMPAAAVKPRGMPRLENGGHVDSLACLKLASDASPKPAPKYSATFKSPAQRFHPFAEHINNRGSMGMMPSLDYKNKRAQEDRQTAMNSKPSSSSQAPPYRIHSFESAKSAASEALEIHNGVVACSTLLRSHDRPSPWIRSGEKHLGKTQGERLFPSEDLRSDRHDRSRPGLSFVTQRSFRSMQRDVAPKKPTSSRFLECASDGDEEASQTNLQPVPWMTGNKDAAGAPPPQSHHILGSTLGSHHVRHSHQMLKSHSMSSCSPPALPIRRGSNHGDLDEDDDTITLGGATTKEPSGACSVVTSHSGVDLDDKTRERIIAQSTSMHIARRHSALRLSDLEDLSKQKALHFQDKAGAKKLSRSASMMVEKSPNDLISRANEDDGTVATSSSGIDLDEAMRNKIVSRSTSLHVARRRRSSLGDNVKTPPRMASHASTSEILRRSSSKANSVHSADRKLSVSSRSSSVHSRRSLRSNDEKAEFRKSFQGGTVPGAQAILGADTGAEKGLQMAAATHQEAEARLRNRNLSSEGFASANLQDEGEDAPRELEAQAGVPVVLPGAFAVRPRTAGEDEDNDGYDSGFEDNTIVVTQESGQPEVDLPSDSRVDPEEPIFQPIVTDAPVQAELYEVEFADAQVLDEEELDSDKGISKKARFLQAFLVLLVITLAVGVTMAIVFTREVGPQKCDGGECTPTIKGWASIGGVLGGPTNTDGIEFGYSVAMSSNGNRIAIGLPGLDGRDDPTQKIKTKIGGTYIMDFNGTDWLKAYEMIGMEVEGSAGSTVAMSSDGKIVAVGAPGTATGGSVTVYQEIDDGSWETLGGILGGGSVNGTSTFGSSLTLSAAGDVLAVGDKYAKPGEGSSDVGAIWVYQRVGDSWQQLGNTIYGEGDNDLFAWSIALSSSGDRVAGSALGSDGLRGEVRVYQFQDEDWTQAGSSLVGGTTRETFGASLGLGADGNVLAVGAPGYSNGANGKGRVQVFQFDEGDKTWQALGDPIDGDNQFDRLGYAVSLSVDGDVLAVGSPENDTFGPNAGFVKTMYFDGKAWTQIGSVLGQSESMGGLFGSSIAQSADGSRIVAGAPEVTYDGKVSKAGRVWVPALHIELGTQSE